MRVLLSNSAQADVTVVSLVFDAAEPTVVMTTTSLGPVTTVTSVTSAWSQFRWSGSEPGR